MPTGLCNESDLIIQKSTSMNSFCTKHLIASYSPNIIGLLILKEMKYNLIQYNTTGLENYLYDIVL